MEGILTEGVCMGAANEVVIVILPYYLFLLHGL